MESKSNRTVRTTTGGRRVNNRSAMLRRLKRKRRIALTSILVFFLVLAAVLITAGIFIYKNVTLTKVDLREYTTLSYSGYDGNGTLYAELNGDGKFDDFFSNVTITITPNGGLCNDDEVQITYSYDKEKAKEQKLWVSGKEKIVHMHGLPDANIISYEELFQNADITWEGISPAVSVTVTNTSTEEFLKTVEFQIDEEKEYFAKGDTVTIKAVFDEEQAGKLGYVIESGPDGFTKEVTIDNVDEYVTDASELTTDQIRQLDQHARTLFGDANEFGLRIFCEAHLVPTYVNGKSTFEWTTPQLISIYFNVLSDESYFGQMGVHMNDVKIVYDAAITQSDGVTSGAEAVVRYDNLIKRADGSIDLMLDSGRIISASGSDKNIKKMVGNQEEEEYTSTKIANP